MDVFIARKPVLDRFTNVYGYKLVHSNVDGAVKDALTGQDNALRPIYDLMLAYEQGYWQEVSEIATQIGLERSDLPGLYLPAVEWASSSLTMAA